MKVLLPPISVDIAVDNKRMGPPETPLPPSM